MAWNFPLNWRQNTSHATALMDGQLPTEREALKNLAQRMADDIGLQDVPAIIV